MARRTARTKPDPTSAKSTPPPGSVTPDESDQSLHATGPPPQPRFFFFYTPTRIGGSNGSHTATQRALGGGGRTARGGGRSSSETDSAARNVSISLLSSTCERHPDGAQGRPWVGAERQHRPSVVVPGSGSGTTASTAPEAGSGGGAAQFGSIVRAYTATQYMDKWHDFRGGRQNARTTGSIHGPTRCSSILSTPAQGKNLLLGENWRPNRFSVGPAELRGNATHADVATLNDRQGGNHRHGLRNQQLSVGFWFESMTFCRRPLTTAAAVLQIRRERRRRRRRLRLLLLLLLRLCVVRGTGGVACPAAGGRRRVATPPSSSPSPAEKPETVAAAAAVRSKEAAAAAAAAAPAAEVGAHAGCVLRAGGGLRRHDGAAFPTQRDGPAVPVPPAASSSSSGSGGGSGGTRGSSGS